MDLTAQDGELVPKDDDLKLLVLGRARTEGDQLDQLAKARQKNEISNGGPSDR